MIALLGIALAAASWSAVFQGHFAAAVSAVFIAAAMILRITGLLKSRRPEAVSEMPPSEDPAGFRSDEEVAADVQETPAEDHPEEPVPQADAVGSPDLGMTELLDEYRALAPQVTSLSRYVMKRSEEAAVQSTESAFSIADEAKKASARVTTLLGDLNDGDDSLGGRVSFLGEKLEELSSLVSDLEDVGRNYGIDMSRMEDLALKVTDHTSAIQDIAERTGVLSINASIEAARAGESGRGFTVIAQEVRKLSDNTTELTDRIATILGEFGEAVSKSSKKNGDRLAGVLDAMDGIRSSLLSSVEVLRPQVESVSLSVAEAESLTGSVSGKLKEVTLWFQTQDALRQTIEHISDAIGDLGARCDELSECAVREETERKAREELTRRFTVADEWEALGLEAPEGGGEVTLF